MLFLSYVHCLLFLFLFFLSSYDSLLFYFLFFLSSLDYLWFLFSYYILFHVSFSAVILFDRLFLISFSVQLFPRDLLDLCCSSLAYRLILVSFSNTHLNTKLFPVSFYVVPLFPRLFCRHPSPPIAYLQPPPPDRKSTPLRTQYHSNQSRCRVWAGSMDHINSYILYIYVKFGNTQKSGQN